MAVKAGGGGEGSGGTADDKETSGGTIGGGGSKPQLTAAQKRAQALTAFTSVDSSTLAGFNVLGLGYTPGSMDEEGGILGSNALIYENGKLLVKNDMINSFYSIFKGQQETARAKAASFLAQDTLLGESASRKGTTLGGII